jgi:hypothetical protein
MSMFASGKLETGQHVPHPKIKYVKAKAFKMSSMSPPSNLTCDGERCYSDDLVVENLPSLCNFIAHPYARRSKTVAVATPNIAQPTTTASLSRAAPATAEAPGAAAPSKQDIADEVPASQI